MCVVNICSLKIKVLNREHKWEECDEIPNHTYYQKQRGINWQWRRFFTTTIIISKYEITYKAIQWLLMWENGCQVQCELHVLCPYNIENSNPCNLCTRYCIDRGNYCKSLIYPSLTLGPLYVCCLFISNDPKYTNSRSLKLILMPRPTSSF